jgi:hypothetical protein
VVVWCRSPLAEHRRRGHDEALVSVAPSSRSRNCDSIRLPDPQPGGRSWTR